VVDAVPTLLITGPVGVGKTTVAGEAANLLGEAGVPHAFVDIDALRWCYPSPPGDRFRVGIALRNLAAVWATYRDVGIGRLILADVLEDRADLAGYERAVPGTVITVVRLRTPGATLAAQVARRETGGGLDWHLARAAELSAQMDRDRVEDLLVETAGRSAVAIAREVLARAGWLGEA
jgi:hypothetical protein